MIIYVYSATHSDVKIFTFYSSISNCCMTGNLSHRTAFLYFYVYTLHLGSLQHNVFPNMSIYITTGVMLIKKRIDTIK